MSKTFSLGLVSFLFCFFAASATWADTLRKFEEACFTWQVQSLSKSGQAINETASHMHCECQAERLWKVDNGIFDDISEAYRTGQIGGISKSNTSIFNGIFNQCGYDVLNGVYKRWSTADANEISAKFCNEAMALARIELYCSNKYWECSKTEEREDICSCFEPSIFKDQAIEEKVRDYLRGSDTFEREELLSFVKHMKSCYSQVGKSLGVQ